MTIRIASRRSILAMLAAVGAGVVLVGAPGSASAQSEPSAEAFLGAIYTAYKGNSDKVKGIPLTSDATIRRYFEPTLAAAIIKDAAQARKRGDVPSLDGDPFIDGQDWDIDSFAIAMKGTGKDKAVGTVTINNFGKAIPVVLDLVKLKDGWRIADIKWERGDTLRDLYKKK